MLYDRSLQFRLIDKVNLIYVTCYKGIKAFFVMMSKVDACPLSDVRSHLSYKECCHWSPYINNNFENTSAPV